MKLSNWDFEIALGLWLVASVAGVFFPPALLIALGTFVNVLHTRFVRYSASDEFKDRLAKAEQTVAEFEKKLREVIDAQNSIRINLGGGAPMQRRMG